MYQIIILLSSLLIASNTAMAEQGLVEGAAKQMATDAATSAATGAVEKAAGAGETVEKAKSLKETAESAPEAIKEQTQEKVKEAATEKLNAATPEEAKQGVKALKEGKETAENLKGKMDSVPKSSNETVKTVKSKVKGKATKKVHHLMH